MKFSCRYSLTCPRTIAFTDDKDASRTIRTGFTDRFVVSHTTQEVLERHFLMDENLYKSYLAWLCSYTFCISMRVHQIIITDQDGKYVSMDYIAIRQIIKTQ